MVVAGGAGLALCAGIERLGAGAWPRAAFAPVNLALRATAYAVIAAFWFEFSWRPWLAALTTVVTVAGLHLVSRLKRSVIGEPLVFSDFALLPQVPRYPQLYYVPPVTSPRVFGPALLCLAVTVLWYALEPSVLPRGVAGWLAAPALPLALLALTVAARRPPVAGWLARRFPRPDLENDIARCGLPATLMAYALRRAAETAQPPAAPARPSPPRPPRGSADPVIVLVQLESFVDPVRLGGDPLPAMDLIRRRAHRHGRLRVPAHGAYTMRTEHAVLTGREAGGLGFGVYDPYLAAGGREPTSLALAAAAQGYETVFVHPFHADFFGRAAVMRRLGFERLVMEDAFTEAARVGPYVADVDLGGYVLDMVRARRGPLLLFCVTMENHGPWKPGRLPGIDDPLAQYLHHVANTGRMVEDLVAGLDGERATLCVYGDHAPSLRACPPGTGLSETEYALFRLGRETAGMRVDLSADALGRRLADLLAEAPAPAPSLTVPRS